MTKLSIVVIIYNIEKYLRQCIDSILAQTFTDYELILVDDGSPDGCPAVCDEYAGRDARVRVLHQANQGSVMARWNGILASEGEYISLIDGDDWLEPDMYAHMMQLADSNGADIVVSGYCEDRPGSVVKKRNGIESGVYSERNIGYIYRNALYTGTFYESGIIPALWNKVIKRQLFFDDFEPADKTIKMGDDAAVSYPMIARSKTIVVDNEFCPLHYRIVEGSLSRAYDELYFKRAWKLIESLNKNLSANNEMKEDIQYYSLFIMLIGVERLLSSDNSIADKKKHLKKAISGLKLFIDEKSVDWQGFSPSDREFFDLLLRERINSLLLRAFKRKLADKIRRHIPLSLN